MIVVSGRLQIRNWNDKDGNKRKTAEVVADNCWFGSTKKDSGGSAGNSGGYGNNYGGYVDANPQSEGDYAIIEGDDTHLPF
jgi:single-strand DNA-binding protein